MAVNENAWQGLDEAMARMRNLGPGLIKRGIRGAARRGAKVFQDAARAGAKRIDDPQSAADISRNIVIRESGKEGKKLNAIVMRVGVRGGARPRNNDPKDTGHWRHVEHGTIHTRAQPFMRPAIANNISKATQAVVQGLIPAIDKAIKADARKAAR